LLLDLTKGLCNTIVMKVPHPIPYQGSKRNLAAQILRAFPSTIDTLIEPFAGSAAISLAAASKGLAKTYHLNDLNKALMDLWEIIINDPMTISEQYAYLWNAQHEDRRRYYDEIRDKFNRDPEPHYFLYLLARCVKGSVRYNADGEFNQSPDNRRRGAIPKTMRENILGASFLLRGKAICTSEDYRTVVQHATPSDLIYMDPPYQGVCQNRDPRYLSSVQFDEFVDCLDYLNSRDIRFIVSYDGATGEKVHGQLLPPHLELTHIQLSAGRSTQATLLGRALSTYESLYLSPALTKEVELSHELYLHKHAPPREQLRLMEAIG